MSSKHHEAIEAKDLIIISNGEVYSYSEADDAINAGGDFTISGGLVFAHSTKNDALDANGNFYIKGGVVYAIGMGMVEMSIDANSEAGCRLYLTGGTVVALGNLEMGSSLTQSCYSALSWTHNTWYGLVLYDGGFRDIRIQDPVKWWYASCGVGCFCTHFTFGRECYGRYKLL